MNQFLKDVLTGLQSSPKQLQSKYFYDEEGDKIFQRIMESKEYYPTDCEMEIFKEQTPELASVLKNGFDEFDLVELGAGDATKSFYVLHELIKIEAKFTYYPIDISSHIISELEKNLPKKIKGLNVKGLNGEYFEMLKKAYRVSDNRKVVLFLGANIGNMTPEEAQNFCRQLRSHLSENDLLMVGFDLKKHPETILNAYNDEKGHTREFNLNLLRRINKELNANFDLDAFDHYPSYDPATGSCKSYLISLQKQYVTIGESQPIFFDENEYIFMEVSQKYSIREAEELALQANFKPVKHFFDTKKWFIDSVWKCV